MRTKRIITAAVVGASLWATIAHADDAWKQDARSSSQATGAPGQAYKSACQTHDQYDAVLACLQAANAQDAVTRIQMEGRDGVNAYMLGFGPIEGCKS